MHFDKDGVLTVQRSVEEFWGRWLFVHESFKPAWWFPPNWILVPIAAFKRRLAYMQAKYYDE